MCYNGTCGHQSCRTCYPCDPCSVTSDCPLQLDLACSIYHKNNNDVSALSNLSLTNGSTLELIVEEIDSKLGALNFTGFALPILRQTYLINTLKQFSEAVEIELADIRGDIASISNATPLTVTDSPTIDLSATGTLNHNLTASVKISGTSGNRLAANTDGLYVGAQTLSPNYITKELTISGGNTISLASMASGVSGYLGSFTSDPAAIEGQEWYNTTTNQLKKRVNNTNKVITTS